MTSYSIPQYVYKNIDGVEYYRSVEDKFWVPDFMKLGTRSNGFKIVCDCGSTLFSLTYGDYELIAHCGGCGHHESVYSG
jgi:hypothetical protein